MADTNTVAMVDGTGEIVLEDCPVPEPEPGELLIEVEASLISPGSNAGYVQHRRENPDPDADATPLGYQGAGDVAAVGDGVDRFEEGDRVACMGSGYAVHGEYATVPTNLCVAIPEEVTYEEASFNHLAATALHTVRRGDLQIGERATVMGLGIVGQLTAQVAGATGARVAGVDMLPNRVEIAREAGVERSIDAGETDPVEAVDKFTDGAGIDCGFICFGGDGTDAFHDLIEMTKEAPDGHEYGRIVIVGNAHVEADYPLSVGNMDVRAASRPGPGYHDPEWERGADYPEELVPWTTRRNLQTSIDLLDRGELAVDKLVTHRFPLSETGAGYEALLESPDETLGVVITA
ncbi:zinc-dependent alcohol dehydrogenase [Halosimplex amylolyticum]|uniref:zinc-dependent alcohol dehydrogenase n=1 Tax=Halosimplex amylolyticum TaxID=3396616 RepID=UPI003F56E9D5